MKFSIDKQDRYCVVTPSEKKLTATIAPDLKTEFVLLGSEGFRNIICDLSDVDYVDSSGLSAFLVAERLCKEQEGIFVLCNLSDDVKKLLNLSQLDTILTTINTLKEAVDYVLLQELERDLK